jgi:hypothetical protein
MAAWLQPSVISSCILDVFEYNVIVTGVTLVILIGVRTVGVLIWVATPASGRVEHHAAPCRVIPAARIA